MMFPRNWKQALRVIARAYKWPPSEMYEFDIDDLSYWNKAAREVLKGNY